jgi:hypothetical protein
VSEELLGFLLWHEVVHSVTPGQGHDAEFEYLETLWPDAVTLNADLDALAHEWSGDPADYEPCGVITARPDSVPSRIRS